MPSETLEEVRLLSNLESNRHKLLQLVLFGQPELNHLARAGTCASSRNGLPHTSIWNPWSATTWPNILSSACARPAIVAPMYSAPLQRD